MFTTASLLGKIGLPAPLKELAAHPWDAIVVGAGHNLIAGHSRLARHLGQPLDNILLGDLLIVVEILNPVGLIREQQVNERKILITSETAGHRRRRRLE